MKRTWKNLRDGLSKCIKKRELLTRSGAAAGKLPKCKLFDQLQFLRDSVSNKATVSNVLTEGSQVADYNEIATEPGSPHESTSRKGVPKSTEPKAALSKRKRKQLDECDELLIDALKQSAPSEDQYSIDPDKKFTESIIPILRNLTPKKNRMAKIEIQQLLLKYEFDED